MDKRKRKRPLIFITAGGITIVIAVVFVFCSLVMLQKGIFSCESFMTKKTDGSLQFESIYKELDFTFQFPANWSIDGAPDIHSDYQQISIFEKGNYDCNINISRTNENYQKRLSKSNTVTVNKIVDKEVSELMKTANSEMRVAVREKEGRVIRVYKKRFKMHFDKKMHLEGNFARWYSYSILTFASNISSDEKPIWVRKEMIVSRKGDWFYRLELSTPESHYSGGHSAFKEVRQTFRFRKFSSFRLMTMWIRRATTSFFDSLSDLLHIRKIRVIP